MIWFVVCNSLMSKTEMPKLLYIFGGKLQRLFFCCFPSSKEVNNTNKKTNKLKISGGQEMKSVGSPHSPQLSFRKHKKVENMSVE